MFEKNKSDIDSLIDLEYEYSYKRATAEEKIDRFIKYLINKREMRIKE